MLTCLAPGLPLCRLDMRSMDPCTLQREKANLNVTHLFKRTIVQPGVRLAGLIPE